MGRLNYTDTEAFIAEVLRRVPSGGATGPAGPTGATGPMGPPGAGAAAATSAALGVIKISGTPADPANPVVYVKEQSDTLFAGKESAGAAAAAIATHVGLGDPRTQYVLDTEKATASGIATLDAGTKIPIGQVPTGSTGATVPFGNDSRFSDARTPIAHAHPESDVTGLVTDLAGKEPAFTTLPKAKGGTAQDNSAGVAQSAFWGGPSVGAGAASYRAMVPADIPSLAASKITSGQLALAQGGTAVDASSAIAQNAVFAGPSGSAGAASFRALAAVDIPSLDAAKIGTGILPIARGGTGVAAPIIRLTTDNAAIAAAAPTSVVVVTTLVWAMLVNEEWDVEWLLMLANSIAADVFAFNVLPSAGTFTGRYWVEGINGVPSAGAGVPKASQNPTGTLTLANANAPGNTGTIGLVTMVRVRAVGKQTVAGANLQVAVRAGTSAAASSGTATVKTQSQVYGTRIA